MSTTTDLQRRQARSGAAVRAAIHKHSIFVMQEIAGWQLCRSGALDHGMVYSCLDAQQVLINAETWDTLCASSEASNDFFAKFMRGEQASGLVNLAGIDWWNRALRSEAKKAGDDVVRGKDAFTELEERMNRLIVGASGFADGSTDVEHLQSFFSQLVTVRADLELVVDRVGQLKGTLDLAETVVAALR